jgi:hypothetical protein
MPVKSTAAGASKLPPPPVKPVCLKDPSYGCANVREFDEYYKQMAEYNKQMEFERQMEEWKRRNPV